MLSNSSQWVTSRRKWRQGISIGSGHGLQVGSPGSGDAGPRPGSGQDAAVRCAPQRRFDLLVHAGVVPGDVDRLMPMPGEQCEELGDLVPALVGPGENHRFARVPVDRARPMARRGLPGRGLPGHGDRHLPTDRVPHRAQRRLPADVERVGMVEDSAGPQPVTNILDRLFLTA
jgi:hypothetical protein